MPLVRLHLAQSLGRCSCYCSLTCADNGTEEQRSSAEVTVTIEDVNDNSPEITSVNPASVLLLESTAVDSTVPVIIMVNDDDVGENAAVSYFCVTVEV